MNPEQTSFSSSQEHTVTPQENATTFARFDQQLQELDNKGGDYENNRYDPRDEFKKLLSEVEVSPALSPIGMETLKERIQGEIEEWDEYLEKKNNSLSS